MSAAGDSEGNRRGIAAMLVAVAAFSLMDAVLKTLTGQTIRVKGYTDNVPIGPELRQRFPTNVSYALRALGLAEAYAIFFIAPLLITMLSIPVLGEKVAPLHWVAIAVGMLGVWIALRPDGEAFFSLGALAVLGAAVCYAVSAVAGRVLSRTDASVTLVFWTTMSLSLGAGVLALPGWVAIQSQHWPVLLALAVTGFVGQLAITEAFRHGKASAVAPFEYTALAWGIALDWSLWRIVPDRYTLLGGAIIIISGLYLLRKGRVKTITIAP